MNKAKIEIICDNPEIIIESVQIDDTTEVKYKAECKKLIFEVETESLSLLSKITYSTINRIQLAMDTVEKFKNK